MFVDIRDKQDAKINRIIRRNKLKKLLNPLRFVKTYKELKQEHLDKKKKEHDILVNVTKGDE
jgi:hypothetical protein